MAPAAWLLTRLLAPPPPLSLRPPQLFDLSLSVKPLEPLLVQLLALLPVCQMCQPLAWQQPDHQGLRLPPQS